MMAVPCCEETRMLMRLVRRFKISRLFDCNHASDTLCSLIKLHNLPEVEKAVHTHVLAELDYSKWDPNKGDIRKSLPLVESALKVLQANTTHNFGDILAQATFLYWQIMNATSDKDKICSEVLITKAVDCMKLWIQWYTSVGTEILKTAGIFRTEMSLCFLQRVANLAIVTFQTGTATTALCMAYDLAQSMGCFHVGRQVCLTLASIAHLLGKRSDLIDQLIDPDSIRILLSDPSFRHDESLQFLCGVAAHHLRNRQIISSEEEQLGKLDKFVIAHDTVSKLIIDSRKESSPSDNNILITAVTKRLNAEFHSLPESSQMMTVTASNTGLRPHPLDLARQSVEDLKSTFFINLGEDFQYSEGSSFEKWRVIHEYLCSLKLYADLSMHTGNVKQAADLFREALTVTKRYSLVTWHLIFLCEVVEMKLMCADIPDAQKLIQDAFDTLEGRRLVKTKKLEKKCSHLSSLNFAIKEMSCAIHLNGTNNEPICSCDISLKSQDENIQLQIMDEVKPALTPDVMYRVTACEKCVEPDIARICTRLMCLQAESCPTVAPCNNNFCSNFPLLDEVGFHSLILVTVMERRKILWNSGTSLCSIVNLLHVAVCSAQKLIQMSSDTRTDKMLSNKNLLLSPLPLDTNMDSITHLDTIYRLAEVYFKGIYIQDDEEQSICHHVKIEIDEIHNLLDIVEREGKKMRWFAKSKVLVTSAMLLKAHMNYLPLLQATMKDVRDGAGVKSKSDRALIRAAVDAVKKKKYSDKKKFRQRCSWKTSLIKWPFQMLLQAGGSDKNSVSRLVSEDNRPKLRVRNTSDEKTVKVENNFECILDTSVPAKSNFNCQKSSKRLLGRKMSQTKKVLDTNCAFSQKNELSTSDKEEALTNEGKHMMTDLESDLVLKFPSLAACGQNIVKIKFLQVILQQLDEFPHSVLLRQFCQSLAMCLWEQDVTGTHECKPGFSVQEEIAAYFTSSMHVAFQHMMIDNFHYKLSDYSWSNLSEEEITTHREAMNRALTSLKFGGDLMTNFTDRMSSVPDDWTVVQVTIVDLNPSNPDRGQVFVTRLTAGQAPITVGLPFQKWKYLQQASEALEETNLETDQSYLPWAVVRKRNKNIQNISHFLQEVFLSGHKWLMRGQMNCVKQPSVQTFLDQASQKTVALVLETHNFSICCGSVRVLLEILLEASEQDVFSLLTCVWPAHVARTVSQICLDVQREVIHGCRKQWNRKRGHLVLILDKLLTKFPWENMPDLRCESVTRVPSLAALNVLITVHMTQSPFYCGVDRKSASVFIPPDSGTKRDDKKLRAKMRYTGWTSQSKSIPTSGELKHCIMDKSLYIYSGHGTGFQYVPGDVIQRFHGKAVAIVMGCESAELSCKGKLDGYGGPLCFLLAGCPAMMGNLWVVTSPDILKLLSRLVSRWMSLEKPTTLGNLLIVERKLCRWQSLNGFAPVIYGLPVVMNC